MYLGKPDPRYTDSPLARRNLALALKIALGLAAVLWLILIVDQVLGLDLIRFGLRPGRVQGLSGLITAPLLHRNAAHLFSNTAPLIVAVTAILYLYPHSAIRAVPIIWVGSGLLAWFIGRPTLHFGASGLIYGLLAYVFISGILRLDMRSVAVSVLVWFLYGSMVAGVLPGRVAVSWELHLSGAILGVALAIVFRHWDVTPLARYPWEDDDSVPDWFPLEQASEEEEEEKQEEAEKKDHPS